MVESIVLLNNNRDFKEEFTLSRKRLLYLNNGTSLTSANKLDDRFKRSDYGATPIPVPLRFLCQFLAPKQDLNKEPFTLVAPVPETVPPCVNTKI